MNQLRALVSDIELCAYLDGEMPAERRVEVDAWLTRHPEGRAKLDVWVRQSHLLRASFGRIAQEPLPRQVTAALLQPTEPAKITALHKPGPAHAAAAGRGAEPALLATPGPRAPRSVWRSLALGVLAVSAATGVVASGALQKLGGTVEPQAQIGGPATPGASLVRHAAEAHAALAPRAETLIDVRSADPAVLTAAAVQAGLDVRLPAAAPGLKTLGLRLTPGDGGLAGVLLFDSERNGRITLLAARAGRGAAPGIILREANGLTIASFNVDGAAYALTGAARRDQMIDWATALRTSLVQPRSLRGS